MHVRIDAYDSQWPERFAAERTRLEQLLRPWLATPVHHIGSTSVPGLASKPVIDMLAGVGDLARAMAAVGPLAEQGYVHAEHRPRALYFYRSFPRDPGTHAHHLHLTEPGSDIWRERLAFRDALRADAVLAAEYQALKRRLAEQYPCDGRSYTAGKRPFVARVLASAGIALRP